MRRADQALDPLRESAELVPMGHIDQHRGRAGASSTPRDGTPARRGRARFAGALPLLLACHGAAATAGAGGLEFADDWVTMGSAPALGASAFTVEAWFRIDGPGQSTGTGYGGIPGIPLVAKGRHHQGAEGNVLDFNYFFGMVPGGRLAGDLEDQTWGQNHPIVGATVPAPGVWHHGALTYDGSTWRLYLDGSLDAWSVAELVPRFDSALPFSIGSAFNGFGQAAGFFDGCVDEVRVWTHARSAVEIRATLNRQVESAAGLVGRWGLDEPGGGIAYDSSGNGIDGTIVGALPVAGAPFDLNLSPDAPLVLAPPDGGSAPAASVTLQATVSDPEGSPLQVTFMGRPVQPPRPGAFTVAVLPDTQYYAHPPFGLEWIFQAQIDWILANREARNIVYVVHVGDIVQGDTIPEWRLADALIGQLETVPDLPYTLAVGNHDSTPAGDPAGTTNFNAFFGVDRYQGVFDWYGGHYGDDNDNSYVLFSAGGVDLLGLTLEYCPGSEVLAWADSVLAAHPQRQAIVVSHNIIEAGNPAAFNACGQPIYDGLKHHSNLRLMLAGHVPGEGRRQSTFNGSVVHTLLADYQSRINGGNGWLRLIELAPGDPEIRVSTISALSGLEEADPDSRFALNTTTPGGPFTTLGTVTVPAGALASVTWPGLAGGQAYEWKVVVSDGAKSTGGPLWSFVVEFAPADFNGDGAVDVFDLVAVLLNWGACAGTPCAGDADGDGDVDVSDLVAVITSWG
jgi:hypothetical protein